MKWSTSTWGCWPLACWRACSSTGLRHAALSPGSSSTPALASHCRGRTTAPRSRNDVLFRKEMQMMTLTYVVMTAVILVCAIVAVLSKNLLRAAHSQRDGGAQQVRGPGRWQRGHDQDYCFSVYNSTPWTAGAEHDGKKHISCQTLYPTLSDVLSDVCGVIIGQMSQK